MENSHNSIELQIDNFLEHFKITVSKATDTSSDWDTTSGNNLDRRSPCIDVADLLSDDNQIEIPVPNCRIYTDQLNKQQIVMHQSGNSSTALTQSTTIITNTSVPKNIVNFPNQSNTSSNISDNILRIADVADLLHPQHIIITGGRSRDGCPLLLLPDNNNFHSLDDSDYKTLILYLTSVPSMQDADLGFNLIIDRRKDKWTAVRAVLLKISDYFPGIIHVVYVLRPTGFFQKAISEVSSKFFKDDFRFRIVFCSCLEELHQELDESQLTQDMGGSLIYSHHEWIQQRISLEKFSQLTQLISADLDIFIQEIHDTELPNSVEDTQQLIDFQGGKYEQLKVKILSAAKHGENLLSSMKSNDDIKQFSERAGNVSSIERLLVQLEETERRFDEFWRTHQCRLKQCLELRKFENEFRELTVNFDVHIQTVSDMTEIGDSVAHVDILINEAKIFQQMCQLDIERAEKVISAGQQLIGINGAFPKEVVQVKSEELLRVCNIITDRLTKRVELLWKNRALMERVEKANQWCARGVELLASQQIEKCAVSEIAEQNLQEILEFISTAAEFKLSSPKEFKNEILGSSTQETKALVTQVLQRIDDVSLMCDKRIACLKKLALKPPRPVQTVTPEPAVPLQPPGGAPHLMRRRHNHRFDSADLRPRSLDGIIESGLSIHTGNGFSPEGSATCQQDLEARKLKTGHVLHELLETEKIYVKEMNSILKGYRDQMHSEEMSHLVPPGLQEKEDILFGNLDELHSFHSKIFLKDLDNCISTTELVALCFVQRRDTFYRLYSFYCQNIPRSDRLRESIVDTQVFFQECQKRLGHKLPLAAYLLKPVQRITKYQLLLKDLLRFSDSSNCIQELQKALDCMLIVLKCVNDSMHQIAITGFPTDLSQQGELLLQDSFQVWTENKKDMRLRLKPQQRHIFLHEKAMLFCKQASKTGHNKSTYQFKNYLKMSLIGLTESVRADPKRFEVWLKGRQEVYTLQASTVEIRNKWVSEVKRVLLNQLEELKGEKIKQYGGMSHRNLRQTVSCDNPSILVAPLRSISSETSEFSNRNSNCSDECQPGVSSSSSSEKYNQDTFGWSSDYSNSEDELSTIDDITTPSPGNRYVALADYCAVGHAEVSIREGDIVELLKIGCAGWWFIKIIDTNTEGWTPGAYLEPSKRKASRS